MKDALPYLAAILLRRLTVEETMCVEFGLGPAVPDQIITNNRLILVVHGKLEYTIEGHTEYWSAGTQFLVPAWVRRVWSVAGKAPCTIFHCAFDDAALECEGTTVFARFLRGRDLTREIRAYKEIFRLWPKRNEERISLRLEAELKSMLGRHCTYPGLTQIAYEAFGNSAPLHAQVKVALLWLKEHFHEPDALAGVYDQVAMTPNYLRRQFQLALGATPQEYLQRLRMRRARHLLRGSNLLQKQIAMEVGYPDSRYFARLYRRFWGHSPATERHH